MPPFVFMRLLSLAAGAALGGVLPALATRRWPTDRNWARWATLLLAALESVGTLLACLLCALAWLEQWQDALLYCGLGAVLGTACSLWGQHPTPLVRGLPAVCVWLCLCLPFTGMLCCVAGIALTMVLEQPRLGCALTATVALPTALVQFGTEYAALVALAATVAWGRVFKDWPRHLPR